MTRAKCFLFPFFILLTLSLKSFACICDRIPIDTSFVYTSIIFEGRVVSQYDDAFLFDQVEFSLITNLEVIKDYKGTRDRKIITIVGGLSCDFSFKVGETYVVFADQSESGIYTASFCSHTQLKSNIDSGMMMVIEKWSKIYNDQFNLTYGFWVDERARDKKEPELAQVLYSFEREKAQMYKYAFFITGFWSIVCTCILVFRKMC